MHEFASQSGSFMPPTNASAGPDSQSHVRSPLDNIGVGRGAGDFAIQRMEDTRGTIQRETTDEMEKEE